MKFQNRKQAGRTIFRWNTGLPNRYETEKIFYRDNRCECTRNTAAKHVTEEPCDPCFRATVGVLNCNFVKLT